jgi:hypothetical protein
MSRKDSRWVGDFSAAPSFTNLSPALTANSHILTVIPGQSFRGTSVSEVALDLLSLREEPTHAAG